MFVSRRERLLEHSRRTELIVTPAIEVANLTKKYGETVAVENLSLTVPGGTMFGFLGPNGSGKSTTIGCLTGLLDPTAGEIRILGEPFRDGAVALKRRMGVMPESLGLFDALYAHEFLFFQARMFGLDEETARRRVTELLDAMELGGTGKKRLSEFSAGMRKRVAFAAAVIHGPDLLFLDEPFESIDPAGRGVHQAVAAQDRRAGAHGFPHYARAGDRGAAVLAGGHHHEARQAGVAGRHQRAGPRWHDLARRDRNSARWSNCSCI